MEKCDKREVRKKKTKIQRGEGGGEVRTEKCAVSRSDVDLDQNKSQQKIPRQRAGGRHWRVNASVCETMCVEP